MTKNELIDLFEKYQSEFLEFDEIENPPSKRPDLCAFLLLDRLVPETGDMISSAEHDCIYLATDINQLAKECTEEDIIYLVRCGIGFDQSYCCLYSFV